MTNKQLDKVFESRTFTAFSISLIPSFADAFYTLMTQGAVCILRTLLYTGIELIV